MSSVVEQPQTTKTRDGRQPGHALRYAKGFARGLLHHGVGHYPKPRYRTVPDPLEAVTDILKGWFEADPGVTGRQLLDRLQVTYPGQYPDSLARTVQRRLKAWRRRERARSLVLGASDAGGAGGGLSGAALAEGSAPRRRAPAPHGSRSQNTAIGGLNT